MLIDLLAEPTDQVRDAIARAAAHPDVDLKALAVGFRSGTLPRPDDPWNVVWFSYRSFRQAWVACAVMALRETLMTHTEAPDPTLSKTFTVLSVLLAELMQLESASA